MGEETRRGEVVVVAAGEEGLVNEEMVREGAVVVDVGMHVTEEGVRGDVTESVRQKAALCSPVPGGVGPMTVACLLENTVTAAKRAREQRQRKLDIRSPVPSDSEISRGVRPRDIGEIAKEAGLREAEVVRYGQHKAKVRLSVLDRLRDKGRERGKMVVVTGVTPGPMGEVAALFSSFLPHRDPGQDHDAAGADTGPQRGPP